MGQATPQWAAAETYSQHILSPIEGGQPILHNGWLSPTPLPFPHDLSRWLMRTWAPLSNWPP